MDLNDYKKFLLRKREDVADSGFVVDADTLNESLFPFQRYCVQKALKKGRYAIFANCGLGKTLMSLEWARNIIERDGMSVVIVAPLAVVGQTIKEGVKFGYKVSKYVPGQDISTGIYITNYDRIGELDADKFIGVILDESSILKNFDGKMKQLIIDTFSKTRYKLACTATPSPNDVMELCNHAEFLNVMNRNEMLAMYFVHDGGNTSSWRLKGHSERVFWDFVASWSVMLCKPSDIGYSDEGYDLPGLNVIEVDVETKKRNNGLLFNDCAVNATNYNEELRQTMDDRMREVARIVNGSEENFIVWIKQDAEGELLRRFIPDAIEVRGSDSPGKKEDNLLGFADNRYRVLVTKLKIAQFGMNYQNCHNQIFASLDFSFEGTYQGIRRSYRFGQSHAVNIYLICTDTMQNVRSAIEDKQKAFTAMQEAMTLATNRNLHTIKEKRQGETQRMVLPAFI